jgi:hypothetical protein
VSASDSGPEKVSLDSDIKEFLLKEFEIVRKDHDALDARLITIIQYLLLFSAVIYSFLLQSQSSTKTYGIAIIWFLPTIASIVASLVLVEISTKIEKINDYLHDVESLFSKDSGLGIGWEHFRRAKPEERKFLGFSPGIRSRHFGTGQGIRFISGIATVILVLNLLVGIAGLAGIMK